MLCDTCIYQWEVKKAKKKAMYMLQYLKRKSESTGAWNLDCYSQQHTAARRDE